MEQRLINKIVQAMDIEVGDIVLLNFWGSEEEIDDFERRNCSVEIRNPYESNVLESLSINRINFAANKAILFPIKAKHNTYIIDIKQSNIRSSAELLNPLRPTIFKPFALNNKSKKISSGIIYTKTPYYLITSDYFDVQRLKKYQELLQIESREEVFLIK